MKILIRWVAILSAICSFVIATAASVTSAGPTVSVNGIPVFKFRTSSKGFSPDELARRAAGNLEGASGIVAVRESGSDHVILVGGNPVVTVTNAEAKFRKMSRQKLAYTWAGELKRALAIAPLKIGVTGVRLGIGEISEVPVAGLLASQAKITSSDPLILEVEKSTWGFFARAKRPGDGFITVTANGITKQVNFMVKPFAMKISDTPVATVTGRPALPGTVKGAVESVLKRQIDPAPLATVTYVFEKIPALGAGLTLNVPVRIKASAPGTIETNQLVNVKVTNQAIVPSDEDVLWYCNDPERITKAGNLFAAKLAKETSARMLYHHLNDTPQGMIVRTLVINDSEVAATMLLIPGDSAPDRDPVGAGMRAGDQFLRAWRSQSGEVVVIPPKSLIPISFRRLAPQQVISGLCSLRLLDGPSTVLVRNDAFPPLEVDARWRPALTSSTPWREVGAQPIRDWDRMPYELTDHIYPNPFRQENTQYRVGGRQTVIRLGQRSIARQDSSGQLEGNFGVSYTIEATLSNPEDVTADVEIVFETSAGYSGGVFFVDEDYIITPKMLAKKEARLGRYRLAPGSIRKVKIVTIPLSGSSYPATLFFRTISPATSGRVIDLTHKRK